MNMLAYQGITLDNFADWAKSGWTRKEAPASPDQREMAIMALGLVGESGEVVEHIKKHIRGDGPVDMEELCLELGDVLHYWCMIARRFDLDIEQIMRSNILKIEKRRGLRAWQIENANKEG